MFAAMQAAARSAENIMARMGGMSDDAEGNTLLANGTACTVVYGLSQVVEKMMPGGGYRSRVETLATITRAQGVVPVERTKLTRTDMTPHISYMIDKVDATNPLSYVLTLVSFG